MIYLDLDGVFADFDKAIKTHAPGKDYTDNPLAVWGVLDKVPNLFANLDVIPGSQWLFLQLTAHHKCQMLTALPLPSEQLVYAQRDKVDWVHKYLSKTIQVNCVQNWRHKKYFCRSNTDVLIDDSPRNISEWVQAGGIGILHTTPERTWELVQQIVSR